MNRKQRIENVIRAALSAHHVEALNESANHAVPKGAETHFKLTVVTSAFAGKTPVERHRMIYSVLGEEMKNGLHALTLQTLTPEEWVTFQSDKTSPPCLGGSKKQP